MLTMRNDEKQKPLTGRKYFESQRVQFVSNQVSELLKKHARIIAFFKATRNNDAQKNKPVIIFKDNLDEGKLFGKCPKCDLFALDIFMQDDKYFLKCESCGLLCEAAEFTLRYEVAEEKPSDNPMQ